MGPVEKGVRADLARLGLDPETSGLAATALVLAEGLDEADTPRENAVVARELRAVLAQMGVTAAGAPRKDIVDELKSRRDSLPA